MLFKYISMHFQTLFTFQKNSKIIKIKAFAFAYMIKIKENASHVSYCTFSMQVTHFFRQMRSIKLHEIFR